MLHVDARVRASWKLACVLLHLVRGWCSVVLLFPRLTIPKKQERIRAWAIALLGLLAIKLVVIGKPPTRGPLLLMCNHISWLDIYVIYAVCHCRFVAKAEVGRWPLIGTLAAAVGTLFIERESRRDVLRVVEQMADSLRGGDLIAVFPEGTSSDGVRVLPFHANLVQAAIAANALVQPVALRFSDVASATHSLTACYINTDTLIGSIWRILNAPPLRATLIFGEQQSTQERGRRAWSADLRLAVETLRQSPTGS
ncbi:lysophospholipid acyltransferase family protein [Rhodoferax sp.]|uniref:lysophospholipid acyltransferase family protein n=1 Tax=Rhodoferax sp. TaxID=50421 RepID=UPI00374D6517